MPLLIGKRIRRSSSSKYCLGESTAARFIVRGLLFGILFGTLATLVSIGALARKLHRSDRSHSYAVADYAHAMGLVSFSRLHDGVPHSSAAPHAEHMVLPEQVQKKTRHEGFAGKMTASVDRTTQNKHHSAAARVKSVRRIARRAPSGEGSQAGSGSCELKTGIDFFGSDLSGGNAADVGACCRQCQQNAACGAFTFVTEDKMCWLKKPRAALMPSEKQGVVSGVIASRGPKPPDPAPESLANPSALPEGGIPTVVITFNRPEYLRRTLESLLGTVPADQATAFPIIVSQQGNHAGVTAVIKEFQPRLFRHLRFTFVDDKKRIPKFEAASWLNYYKMSHHYEFAIRETFALQPPQGRFDHLIVMEDDLQVAPDFFEFFAYMAVLLDRDARRGRTLYCASAWNDNGTRTQPIIQNRNSIFFRDACGALSLRCCAWGEHGHHKQDQSAASLVSKF